jgi:hypothetical protein
MRTFSYFEHRDRKVHIYKHHSIGPRGQTLYRAALDGEDLPIDWPNPHELELAVKKLLDETP